MDGRHFIVGELLGRGGFGAVYRAELRGEGGFTKPVALKVLNPDMLTHVEVSRRFRDEARLLGLLRHRAIVGVDGLLQLSRGTGATGFWTVVMELVEGGNLEEMMQKGPVPPAAACEIVAEVASALHAAWSHPGPRGQPLRLMHRDIKPSNIQVTPAGEVKLLDFGIARADFATREAETKSLAFGTLEYMSPERVFRAMGQAGPEEGETPTSDIYSLGAVLQEVISGRRFKGDFQGQAQHDAKIAKAIERMRNAIGERVDGLEQIVADMLAYDPKERPTPREVHRLCLTLAREVPGPGLLDWTEYEVPRVIQARVPPPADALCGSTLFEQTPSSGGPSLTGGERIRSLLAEEPEGESQPTMNFGESLTQNVPTSSEVPRRRSLVLPLLVLLLVLVIGFAGLSAIGVGAVWWASLPPAEPVAVVAPAEPPPAPMEPVEEAIAEVADPMELEPELSPPTPAPAPVVSTRRAEPTPSSEATRTDEEQPTTQTPEPSPKTGRVSVTGDGGRVVLVAGGQPWAPGDVPPGIYEVRADFGKGEMVVAGKVSVLAGSSVVVKCNSRFTRCAP